MTVVTTVALIFGMAVLGVPIILGLLTPVVGFVVERALPEPAWDGLMLLWAQAGSALATYLIGALALGLPWYAALIAAFLVGITSYARRDPSAYPMAEAWGEIRPEELDATSWPDYEQEQHIDRRIELENQDSLARQGVAACPVCGKTFPKPTYVEQHLASKHPEFA
jgi:hypothetical protein